MLKIKELKCVYTAEHIRQRVDELAERISRDYRDSPDLICVCVLTGAVFFFSDLVRQLDLKDVRIDFMRVSSYGGAVTSSGSVSVTQDLKTDVAGHDVLVIEDVIDSGLTMQRVLPMIKERGARSVRLCAMVDKREKREVPITIDYPGFVLNSGFIVGYGLDLAEQYRNLPAIYEVIFEEH